MEAAATNYTFVNLTIRHYSPEDSNFYTCRCDREQLFSGLDGRSFWRHYVHMDDKQAYMKVSINKTQEL
jgi:hypothetical protein